MGRALILVELDLTQGFLPLVFNLGANKSSLIESILDVGTWFQGTFIEDLVLTFDAYLLESSLN